MTSKVRVFDFDPSVDLHTAVDIIEVALEDEGLTLVGRSNQGNQVAYAVRYSGSADGLEAAYLRVIVPTRFIAERS